MMLVMLIFLLVTCGLASLVHSTVDNCSGRLTVLYFRQWSCSSDCMHYHVSCDRACRILIMDINLKTCINKYSMKN